MEKEILSSSNYPGIVWSVYAPKWYLTGHPDEYSQKVLASKKEDLSNYFKPYMENLIKELNNFSLLGEVQIITILPNSYLSYSPTLESIGIWLATILNSKFEKIIKPLKTGRRNKKCANANERYKETFGSMEVLRELDKKESSVLLIDDMKTSGTTLLESIRILKLKGAKTFYIICLSINHNPKRLGGN